MLAVAKGFQTQYEKALDSASIGRELRCQHFRKWLRLEKADVLSYAKADPGNNAIYKSAEDACQGNSPGDELFKPFNALATLLAAIEILPEVSE